MSSLKTAWATFSAQLNRPFDNCYLQLALFYAFFFHFVSLPSSFPSSLYSPVFYLFFSYCHYFTQSEFFIPAPTGCFSLSDSKSSQLSRPFLSVLTNFNNAVVWLLLHYHFTSCEFFTTTLANGLSLEFEWQQVSLSFQDSSRYSGRS